MKTINIYEFNAECRLNWLIALPGMINGSIQLKTY
jgi:hypothetical protein